MTQDPDFSAPHGGTADGYCPDSTGHCFVTFYKTPDTPNSQIVETDYDSYSIVYTCGFTKNFVWFLTREPVISDELYNYMYTTAQANLPNFKFSTLDPREYQGDKCAYAQAS